MRSMFASILAVMLCTVLLSTCCASVTPQAPELPGEPQGGDDSGNEPSGGETQQGGQEQTGEATRTRRPTRTPAGGLPATGTQSGNATHTPPALATLTNTPLVGVIQNQTDTPAPCSNLAEFIGYVQTPLNTVVAANQAFTVTWRVRNTGTCTWDLTYSFVLVGNDALGSAETFTLGSVADHIPVSPGETVDISVDMVAPGIFGTYSNWWQLHSKAGNFFNGIAHDALQMQIIVPMPTRSP